MKKLQYTLAIAAIAPMLAACAPSPDKVCAHTMELVMKEMPEGAPKMDDAKKKEAQDDCVKKLTKEQEMQGMVKYKEEASCAMKATNMEELMKCDKKEDDKKGDEKKE